MNGVMAATRKKFNGRFVGLGAHALGQSLAYSPGGVHIAYFAKTYHWPIAEVRAAAAQLERRGVCRLALSGNKLIAVPVRGGHS